MARTIACDAQVAPDDVDAHPGHDADHQRFRRQPAVDLGHHLRQDLRLDAQNQDLAGCRGLDVVGRRAHTVAAVQFLTALDPRPAGGDVRRVDQIVGYDAFDHRLGHRAGTDEAQGSTG